MARLRHYQFRTVWNLDAPCEHVLAVVRDLESYPRWWPEVKAVTPLGDGRFEVRARSVLPFELRIVAEESARAERSGTIEARLRGELEGFARWTLEDAGGACRLVFEQDVETRKTLLDALAPVARPAFRLNHRMMMRHGLVGLQRFLAGNGGPTRRSRPRP